MWHFKMILCLITVTPCPQGRFLSGTWTTMSFCRSCHASPHSAFSPVTHRIKVILIYWHLKKKMIKDTVTVLFLFNANTFSLGSISDCLRTNGGRVREAFQVMWTICIFIECFFVFLKHSLLLFSERSMGNGLVSTLSAWVNSQVQPSKK